VAKRAYRLGRRGAAAEETRRRLVQATFELHQERGVVAVGLKDIAERAGVSVGTAYHHFPSHEQAVNACSAHVLEIAPPVDVSIFEGARDEDERIDRMARAVFERYERLPGWSRVRADAPLSPLIAEFDEAERYNRHVLVLTATMGRQLDPWAWAMAAALFDVSVYETLRAAKMTTEQAAAEAAGVLKAWLPQAEAGRKPAH
jgi:AcrR family transcriptional regulator